MRFRRLGYRLVCLITIAVCCQAATADDGTDVARFMPKDTALYVGWTPWVEEDSAELRAGRKYLDAALAKMAEAGGEQGAAWAKMAGDAIVTLELHAGGIGLIDVEFTEQQPKISAALVLDSGADSTKLVEILRDVARAARPADEIKRLMIGGAALESMQFGDPGFELDLTWGVYQDRFLLTLGPAAEQVVACMNGSGESLADAPEFKFDRQKVNARLDGKCFCFYADVRRIITRGKEIAEVMLGELPPMVDQALAESGVASVRSKYLHIDEQNGAPRMMAFAHVDGPMQGLLKLFDQAPLQDEDLKIVPKNAYWAEVGNLDLAGLWEEIMRIVAELAPEHVATIEGPLAMVNQMLGFSVTGDLLPAFGDTWALFDARDHGGILLTGTVLVAEVKDSAALQGMLGRITQMVGAGLAQEDVTIKLRQLKHGEHTIHYVLIGGVPSPVAPAWCFVGDRWVFGLFPQTVAAAIKQVDPATRGESILDHPDVRAARAKLPSEIQGFGFYDSRYFVRLIYPLLNAVQTVGVSMLADQGIEIDLEMMPPVAEMAADVTSFVGVTSKDADGIMCASVGDGAPLAAVMGAAALGASIALPTAVAGREQGKAAVSAASLRSIGMACHMYANDNQDKPPESLEQLIEAGYIDRRTLESPFGPTGAVGYEYVRRTEPAATERQPAQNVLAYERYSGGAKINVLFADGHTEAMPYDRLRETLRETYRRLGREAEIPPEFRD